MKVNMRAYEKKALDYCKKFVNSWELYIVAKDAYLHGYEDARKDSSKVTSLFSEFITSRKIRPTKKHIKGLTNIIKKVNDRLVEVEFKDGSHQLKGN